MKANARYTRHTHHTPPTPSPRRSRALLIFVALFLAVALIFCTVLGILALRRNAAYVLKYDGVGMTEGVATYLVSYYKGRYLAALRENGVADADDLYTFWSREAEDGVSYGERFTADARRFLLQILVEASLYRDGYSTADKRKVEAAAEELLTFQADGSRELFDQRVEIYGFNYRDFLTATELLYRAEQAVSYLYGSSGTRIYSDTAFCEEYLAGYTHVQLIFIREYTLPDKNEKGEEIYRDMTEEERQERARRIAELEAAIRGDGGVWISPELFETLRAKYDESGISSAGGYYFRTGSRYTEDFAALFPEVLAKAEGMKLGDYASVDTEVGTCFLYRLAPQSGAYTDATEDGCFSDFASLAAEAAYAARVTALTDEVVLTDALRAIDMLAIPYQYEYVARFS